MKPECTEVAEQSKWRMIGDGGDDRGGDVGERRRAQAPNKGEVGGPRMVGRF